MKRKLRTNRQHNVECPCDYCKYGHEFMKIKENNELLKYGWFAHIVTDDCACPSHFNMHTHGLERFGHFNLQCCHPIHPDQIMPIFHDIADKIMAGRLFGPDRDYDEFLKGGYKVRFLLATEGGRNVLRLLIPDKNGKYEGKYAAQLTMLEHK